MPLAGDVRLLDWRIASGALAIGARVADDLSEPAALAVRQVAFPGWRAWVDGQPVEVGISPYVEEQQATLGFIVVQVPPGEHTVSLAFGPTPLRLASLVITALTVVAGATAGVLPVAPLPGRAAPLLAGLLLLAGGAGYLAWRGVPPCVHALHRRPGRFGPLTRPGWRLARAPLDHRGAGLLVNLAEAARSGAARIELPTGASLGADRFVDVRQLTVVDANDRERGLAGTSRRQWLFTHPPASVAVDVVLPPIAAGPTDGLEHLVPGGARARSLGVDCRGR